MEQMLAVSSVEDLSVDPSWSSSWFFASSGCEGWSRVLVGFWFDMYFLGEVRNCFWEWMLSCCMRIWLFLLENALMEKIRGLCQCQFNQRGSMYVPICYRCIKRIRIYLTTSSSSSFSLFFFCISLIFSYRIYQISTKRVRIMNLKNTFNIIS